MSEGNSWRNVPAAQPGKEVLVPFNQLVDRCEQIDTFSQILSSISLQRPVPKNLLEWDGGPGVGKTVLTRMLQEECDRQDVPWVLVDFKALKQQGRLDHYMGDPTTLFEDLAGDLRKHTRLDTGSLDSKIGEYRNEVDQGDIIQAYARLTSDERLYNKPQWLVLLRDVALAFIKLVDELEYEDRRCAEPVAFFFDETEGVAPELTDWVEEWIINPLAQMRHCVIVWMARRPWRWKRPEVRNLLRQEALGVFEPDDVKSQVKLGSSYPDITEQFFGDIYAVTGGHPFASRVAISKLDGWLAEGQNLTAQIFVERQSEMLADIFGQFVVGYAFQGLSADERTACELLSLVRLFDTRMLQEVLVTCGPTRFRKYSLDDFGYLLEDLRRTDLLQWEKGWSLDRDLRYVLREYYWACHRDTYVATNQAALRVCQYWLKRPVDARSQYIVEELYHYASLLRAGKQANLEGILAGRLEEYRRRITDPHALCNALERLEGELLNDSELAQLTDSASTTKLVAQVHAFMSSIPDSAQAVI